MNKLAPIAFGLLGFVLPARALANHCEDCNDGLPTQLEVGPAEMPPDGVLMLTLIDESGWSLNERWWNWIEVEVRDSSGLLVDGALELDPDLTPGWWRPTEPWEPDVFTVTVTIIEGPGQDCNLPGFSRTFASQADLAAPSMPSLIIEESYSVGQSHGLENYVCCDGAAPREETSTNGYHCPGQNRTRIVQEEGFCTRAESTGSARATATLDEVSPTRFTLRETTTRRRPANNSTWVSASASSEHCFDFEVTDLVTGTRTNVEHCIEEQPGSPLGLFQNPDAAEQIEAECAGPAYVCSGATAWIVPEECTLWPSGEPLPSEEPPGDTSTGIGAGTDPNAPLGEDEAGEDGAGCRIDPASGHPHRARVPLLLLFLAAGLRRRSASSARR